MRKLGFSESRSWVGVFWGRLILYVLNILNPLFLKNSLSLGVKGLSSVNSLWMDRHICRIYQDEHRSLDILPLFNEIRIAIVSSRF